MSDRFYQTYKSGNNSYLVGNKTPTNNYPQFTSGRIRQGSWNVQLQRKLSPTPRTEYDNHQDKQSLQYSKKAKYGFLRSTISGPFTKKYDDYKYLSKNNQSQHSSSSLRFIHDYQSQKQRNQQYRQKSPQFGQQEKSSRVYQSKKYTGHGYESQRHLKDDKFDIDYTRMAISPRSRTKKYSQHFNSNLSYSQVQNKNEEPKPYQWLKKYNDQVYLGKTKSLKYENTQNMDKKLDNSGVNRFSKKASHYEASKYDTDKNYIKNSPLRQTTSNTYKNYYDFLNQKDDKPLSTATTVLQDNIREFKISTPSKTESKTESYSTSPNQSPMKKNKLSCSRVELNQKQKSLKKLNDPQQLDLGMISAKLEALTLRQSIKFTSPPTLNDFVIIKPLGQGRFGTVSLALHKRTKFLFALKKIKKDQIKEHKLQKQFLTQVKIQMSLNHPHILGLYGFFDDEKHVYLILEYAQGGNIYDQLKKQKVLSQQKASQRLKQVLSAIEYIHEKQIGHRDLKPENIVVSNNVCKLCDFGSSAEFVENRRRTIQGSPDYISTQVLKGQQYGLQIDLWSLGVLAFELLVGKTPFYHIKLKKTLELIRNASTQQINYPDSMSYEAKNFIKRLIVKQPQQRMTISDALNHKFIKKYQQSQ